MSTDPQPPRPLDLGDIEIVLQRDSRELREILRQLGTNTAKVFGFTPIEVQMQGDGGPAKVTLRFVGTQEGA